MKEVSQASCTESRTKMAEESSPEVAQEAAEVSSPIPVLDPMEGTSQLVRWLNAKFRLDGDKSDKSMKVGTKFAYTLPDD